MRKLKKDELERIEKNVLKKGTAVDEKATKNVGSCKRLRRGALGSRSFRDDGCFRPQANM